MVEEKIRLGIIGANAHYGWSMRAHLPALLALPEFELTAVCTAHPKTAEESAKQYGARLAFHDYREMVRHPDIDLVSVSVRVPLHHRMVMAALEAGKHVFCEWPLGANLKEAKEMAALARAKGVCNMVGLQARGAPALLRLKELMAEGYVGEVLACTMSLFLPGLLQRGLDRAWMADREKGANTLTIATGHAIDAFCFCVGEIQELSARVSTRVPLWETSEPGKPVKVTAADDVIATGELAGGAVASFHVATVPWHGSGWRLEVYGRNGTLVASSPETVQYGKIQLEGGQSKDRGLKEIPLPSRLVYVPGKVPEGAPFNVAQLYRTLGYAIRRRKPASPDFDLAVARHRLLDTIERASEQGTMQAVA